MIIDWLIETTIETTVLITLVLLIRPLVRRTLGAKVGYWLWLLPIVNVVLPSIPMQNSIILNAVELSTASLSPITAPVSAVVEVAPSYTWQMIWIVGLCLWLTIRTLIWFRFRQTLAEHSQRYDIPQQVNTKIFQKIHCSSKKIQYYRCSNPSAPFVTGLFSPRIYLPQDFEQRFAQEEQVWVLVHELTHIKRFDLWVQGLSEFFRAVFWFNPVVHFATQVMQSDQEMACDHSVLSHCKSEDRYQYGKALMAGVGPHLLPSIMTFFGKSKERFAMLSKHKVSTLNSVLGLALCVVVSAVSLITSPTSIAQSGLIKDEEISLDFIQIPLNKVVHIITEFSGIPVFNKDFIDDDFVISIHQKNVPADEVLARALKCGGYDYIEYESGIELIQSPSVVVEGERSCVVREDGAVVVKADVIRKTDGGGA